MASLKVGDIIIATGMRVRARESADENGIAPAGLKPVIYKIMQAGNDPHIGLYNSAGPVSGYDWHDFEGEVEDRCGYWVQLSSLIKHFDIQSQAAEITGDVFIRGRNLKGMNGKVLASADSGLVFLELDEDVGGCSADGLGKAGHCVAVPATAVNSSNNYKNLSDLEFEVFF